MDNCKKVTVWKQCQKIILDKMIYTAEQYFSRKQKMLRCKTFLKREILHLAVLVLLCVLVGTIITKSTQETISHVSFLQNKPIMKNTRGVFPPLSGDPALLLGCWAVQAAIRHQGMDVLGFKSYALCFEKSRKMGVLKLGKGCIGGRERRAFNWRVFSYNIFVSPAAQQQLKQENSYLTNLYSLWSPKKDKTSMKNTTPSSQSLSSNTTTAPPLPTNSTTNPTNITASSTAPSDKNSSQPVKSCWNQKQEIMSLVRSLTVWTIRNGELYLITEASDGNNIIVLHRLQ